MPVMRLREKLFMKQTVIVIIKRKYNCRKIIKKFKTSQTFFKRVDFIKAEIGRAHV